jgi:hypothetical protein
VRGTGRANTGGDRGAGNVGRLRRTVGGRGGLGRWDGHSEGRLCTGLSYSVGLCLAVVAFTTDGHSDGRLRWAIAFSSDDGWLRSGSGSGVDHDISSVDSRVVRGSEVGAVDDRGTVAADSRGAGHEGVGCRGKSGVDGGWDSGRVADGRRGNN